MFDVAPSEFFLIVVVALVVIGPKDLPRVMMQLGKWVGKARGVASHFRTGFDAMVREAELEELEKQWAAENARIMAQFPIDIPPPPPPAPPPPAPPPPALAAPDAPAPAVSLEKPQ